MSDRTTGAPRWQVTRGNPDEHELAALLAVLTATTATTATIATGTEVSAEHPVRPAVSRWADPAWQPGAPIRPGHDAWCASLLPH
jgi:hypothetical protein